MEQKLMRLHKFIAQSGLCSRRKAELLIADGKISVNGQEVTTLGFSVDPKTDKVEYNGRQVTISNEQVYYALHKPVGHISSTSNSQGKSVMQLLPKKHRLFLVGRLDNDSSGLIIATNDGDFALKASHPRYGCEKEYFVTLDRDLSPEHILKMQKGMTLKGEKLAPVKIVNAKNKSARIVLKQGVNRQIRRMVGSLGYTVVKLKRVRIGKLEIGDLEVGKNMKITPDQVI